MIRPLRRALVAAVLLLVLASPAVGQTWTGNSNTLWNLASNWSALPASSIDTQLIFGATANASPQNNFAGTFLLNRMTFNAGAPIYNFSGNPLEFRNNGLGTGPQIEVNSANAVTIANNLVLTNTLTIVGTGAGRVTLNGVLSGAGGLTKSATSPPTLFLGGVNTFGAAVAIDSGVLSITNPRAIPAGRDVTVASGAEFRIGFGSGNNSGFAIGTVTLNGGTFAAPTAGATDYHINQLVVNPLGAVNFTGSSAFGLHLTGAGAGITIGDSATWTGGGSSLIQNDTAAPVGIDVKPLRILTNGIRLANGILGQGFRLTGEGSMILTNTGNTAHLVADESILRVDDMAHLGTGTITLQRSAGFFGIFRGSVQYSGPTASSTKALVLNAGGGMVFVSTVGTNLTLSGTISEAAAGQQFLVTGAGGTGANSTLTLTGSNTYTGPTLVARGTLSVASLPNGGVAGPVGASSNAPANLVIGTVGNGNSLPGTLRYTGPTAATDRGMTFGPDFSSRGTLEVSDPVANLTVTGQITGGQLNKSGPGTLTLGNQANNFTGGVNVAGGALAISHPTAIPAGQNVTVASGAEFQIGYGSGNNVAAPIGTLTLNGGTFAVPTPGFTDYFTNRLVQAAGSTVDFTDSTNFKLRLFGTGAGIIVTGNGTWTGVAQSMIVNSNVGPMDLSIAPGATLTSSIRLLGEFRLTGGGTLAVTNTDNSSLTVGPATLQFGSVAALGTGTLTLDGGTLAYTGPTATTNKSLGLAAGGGTVSVTDPAATLTWNGQITGGNTLTKAGPGTLILGSVSNTFSGLVVNTGRVDVAFEAPLGLATVTVNAAGTLRYTATATTTKTFTLNSGTLEVPTGVTLTLNGAAVNGGFLRGSGNFALTGNAAVNGSTILPGTTVNQTGPATLRNVSVGGNLTNSAGQTLTWDGGFLTGAGQLTVNGIVNATAFESSGVIRVTGGAAPGRLTVSGSPLVLFGGSRTFVGAPPAAQRGGTINLGGQTLELNGGLLVNNGDFIAVGNGGIQNGVVNVNFGSLAKGTGFYDSVNVTDGGKFAPGNSITNTTSGTLTLNSGSIYEFEINRASGTPGGGGGSPPTGWDLLNLLVALNINSTSSSPATIQLVSRNSSDNGPGTLPDFNPNQPFQWLAFHLNAGGSVNGFSADKFTFDTAGFANLTNPSGVGTFSLNQVGNDVFVTYAPVPEASDGLAMLAAAAAATAAVRARRRRGILG